MKNNILMKNLILKLKNKIQSNQNSNKNKISPIHKRNLIMNTKFFANNTNISKQIKMKNNLQE